MEDVLCLDLLLSAMRHGPLVNQPYHFGYVGRQENSLDLSISFLHF